MKKPYKNAWILLCVYLFHIGTDIRAYSLDNDLCVLLSVSSGAFFWCFLQKKNLNLFTKISSTCLAGFCLYSVLYKYSYKGKLKYANKILSSVHTNPLLLIAYQGNGAIANFCNKDRCDTSKLLVIKNDLLNLQERIQQGINASYDVYEYSSEYKDDAYIICMQLNHALKVVNVALQDISKMLDNNSVVPYRYFEASNGVI